MVNAIIACALTSALILKNYLKKTINISAIINNTCWEIS